MAFLPSPTALCRHIFTNVLVFGIAFFSSASEAAAAEDTGPSREPWTIVVLLENDSVLGIDDRHYTSGLYISATSGGREQCAACTGVARATMLAPGTGPIRYRFGFSLSQSMFTPENLSRQNPDPSDRPYAGWLLAGAQLYRDSGEVLDRVEVQAGIVGPGSGADAVQRWWHALHWFGGVKPNGWHAQIKDEPGLIISERRIWRRSLSDGFIGAELLPQASVTLGNVLTYASAGATLRIGRGLKADWGPPRVQPAIEGSDYVDFNCVDGFGWYVFAGVEGRVVAHNISLDGNSLQHSASVSRELLVGDLNLGFAVLTDWARFTVSYTERTREFRTQRGDDNFMSLSLSFAY